jgi:hypothetical protein
LSLIILDIPVSLDPEETAKKLHISPASLREIPAGFLSRAQEAIKPRAAYRVGYVYEKSEDSVKIGTVTFQSRILRVNLDQAGKVFPYVLTLGEEIEQNIQSCTNPLLKYCLGELAHHLLGRAQEYLLQHLGEQYALGKPARMNPGSLPDWPLEQQQHLFSLLGPGQVAEALGVRLTPSFLMVPVKSLSGIIFPSEQSFESCQLCPREDCPGRRAPYREDKLKSYFPDSENSGRA